MRQSTEMREDRNEATQRDAAERTAPAVDVRLDNVSKRFGDVWALRPTSLSIDRGEFFSLLGASGSGKTTTLRIIGGFEEPTSGRVILHDKDLTRTAPYERNVNTVFQDYALFPHMDVAQNIGYGLRVRGVNRRERARRVGEALELVRLTGYKHRRPSQLSGGQRQRVALARALVNMPAVLLLDEPLGALDLKLRREMQQELRRIQHDVGITFIYVTHDQEEAMSMSDRVAVMHDGQIEQVGTPTEVYERPANMFVAGFVGVSNVLHGIVESRDGALYRVAAPGSDSLMVPASDGRSHRVAPAVGQSIALTVRPEKIRMVTSDHVPVGFRGTGFDLVSASGDASLRFIHSGAVQAVDLKRIPNWKDLAPQLKSPPHNTVNGKHYGVSFMWGPDSLIYNTKYFKTAPTSWSVIYNPKYKGKITIPDNAIQIADVAVYLHYKHPYNLTDAQLSKIKSVLQAQRPLIRKFWGTAGDFDNLFKSGEAIVGAGWPLMTVQLKQEHVPVAETIPHEGATGWADTWMLSTHSSHTDCAYAWMNYVISPAVQKQVVAVTDYSPANLKTAKLLGAKQAAALHITDQRYFNSLQFWQTPPNYPKWQTIWNEIKG